MFKIPETPEAPWKPPKRTEVFGKPLQLPQSLKPSEFLCSWPHWHPHEAHWKSPKGPLKPKKISNKLSETLWHHVIRTVTCWNPGIRLTGDPTTLKPLNTPWNPWTLLPPLNWPEMAFLSSSWPTFEFDNPGFKSKAALKVLWNFHCSSPPIASSFILLNPLLAFRGNILLHYATLWLFFVIPSSNSPLSLLNPACSRFLRPFVFFQKDPFI